jgi:hypothetical protein
MISQGSNYTVLRLIDKQEKQGSFMRTTISGIWKPTSKSHNDKEIQLTSANPEYFFWEYFSLSNILYAGTKMGRGSHKAGEETLTDALVTLLGVMRGADGTFKAPSGREGKGTLNTDWAKPEFTKGDIEWHFSNGS